MFGWTCPKCGSVYGPSVRECWRCNKVDWTPNQPSTGDPLPPQPYTTCNVLLNISDNTSELSSRPTD